MVGSGSGAHSASGMGESQQFGGRVADPACSHHVNRLAGCTGPWAHVGPVLRVVLAGEGVTVGVSVAVLAPLGQLRPVQHYRRRISASGRVCVRQCATGLFSSPAWSHRDNVTASEDWHVGNGVTVDDGVAEACGSEDGRVHAGWPMKLEGGRDHVSRGAVADGVVLVSVILVAPVGVTVSPELKHSQFVVDAEEVCNALNAAACVGGEVSGRARCNHGFCTMPEAGGGCWREVVLGEPCNDASQTLGPGACHRRHQEVGGVSATIAKGIGRRHRGRGICERVSECAGVRVVGRGGRSAGSSC